ncbi:MAG: alkyl hydroperoxide reductase [Candidatus Hydrogenedentes bacterium]|nr:alkyl hydroperoxide reductase [Candidatus Hydrogenedentota bacterium]
MIREVVLTKQMPPWHADPAYNQFENDRSLTPEEERRLLAWLDAGAPKEETEPDPLAETKAIDTAEWVLGQPDVIVQIPEVQTLPAEGAFEYRYFYVPTGLTEDKWVKAVDVQPTNRAVLHHALVFVIYPDQYAHIQPEVRGGLNGYFAAFLPGTKIKPYPEGTGQFLPAGALLVFQMHYNATGKEEQDQTRLGLYFHDAPPPRALMIQAANETEFEIPPNTEDFPTRADWQAPQDVEVYGLSPHMHYRGSRFTFAAHTPDGQEQVLLNVPHYVFDWQPMYMFQKPLVLPANTVIGCDGAFDNSKFNPRNPDPSQTVTFGEQSWEEMFIGYITFSAPRDDNYFKPQEVKQYPPITEENLGGTEWRMGRRFTLTFNADKTISVRGQAAGTWAIKDGRLQIDGFGRHLEAIIYGDDLLVDGRRLRRVEPGEEPPREPREKVSSNR